MDSIEGQASRLKAASGQGALFQIHLTAALADRIASWLPEGMPEWANSQADLQAILRHLYSVSAYIETLSGAVSEQACSDYYMPRGRDPHDASASINCF